MKRKPRELSSTIWSADGQRSRQSLNGSSHGSRYGSTIPPIARRPKLALPNGARVAVWIVPNVEHFHYDKPAMALTPMTAGLKPDVLELCVARLRRARRHLAADGDPRAAGLSRHRGAQLRGLPALPGDRRGRKSARLGMDGARSEQFHALHRHARGGGAADHRTACSSTIAKHTGKTRARLARSGAHRDRQHARSARRGRRSTTSPTGATTSSPTR